MQDLSGERSVGIAIVLALWSFGITMGGALLICRALQNAAVFSIDVQRPGARSVVLGKREKVIFVEMIAAVVTVVFVVVPAGGVIGRNSFVGVRTRATTHGAAAWRRGHQAAVLPTSVAAGGVIVLGTTAAVTGRTNDVSAVLLCAAVLLAGGLWSVAAAQRAVRKAPDASR